MLLYIYRHSTLSQWTPVNALALFSSNRNIIVPPHHHGVDVASYIRSKLNFDNFSGHLDLLDIADFTANIGSNDGDYVEMSDKTVRKFRNYFSNISWRIVIILS